MITFLFNVLRGILFEKFHTILRRTQNNLPCTFVFYLDHLSLYSTSRSTRLVLIHVIIYSCVILCSQNNQCVHIFLIETTRNYSTHANNIPSEHIPLQYIMCMYTVCFHSHCANLKKRFYLIILKVENWIMFVYRLNTNNKGDTFYKRHCASCIFSTTLSWFFH